MNNSKSWPNKNRGGNKNRGKGPGNYGGKKNYTRSERGERHFPKFADTGHMNDAANYWPKDDRNCDKRNSNYLGDVPVTRAGIYPWIRKKPANPLIIPHHINFEQQYEYQDDPSTNKTVNKQIESTPVEKPYVSQIGEKEINVCKIGADSVSGINSVSEAIETSKLPETNIQVKIKPERDLINIKQERKSSSSSSSSSSSESSSSDEDPDPRNKQEETAKPEVTPSSIVPSSPLNIKLKPKQNSANSPPVKMSQNVKTIKEPSSTSSSSDEESGPPTPLLKSAANTDNKKEVKAKSSKNKNSSEDDVVCIGNLENKIILDDEEHDKETAEKNLNKTKKSGKKATAEDCMICDKKGHTSFQCQMICKNCSAPYHGYRTCPHTANLNTALQLFIEFCMQQFQNFNSEKQIATNPCDSFPKPQVYSHHSASVSNKSNKLKRKQVKANEINTKNKSSKKRKISASKKTKSKADSDDSSDDDNDDDDTDSETSSTDSEGDISTAESLVSSKRKRKMKSRNAFKAALHSSKFSTNPVNLPMVLNGFPNLTVPTASIHNTNTSTSALNTLLLTQMFQNAIGSLKQ